MATYDTIVIGAGLAGIAAAQRLTAGGRNIAVVEARERFGGRVFTAHEPTVDFPLELGPEWFNSYGEIRALYARDEKLVGNGKFLRRIGGRLRDVEEPDDGWADLHRRLEVVEGPDLSVNAAIKRCCSDHKSARAVEALRHYVAGFHAADPAALSLEWLRQVEQNQSAGESERRGHGPDLIAECTNS